jgi:hypothetical protein
VCSAAIGITLSYSPLAAQQPEPLPRDELKQPVHRVAINSPIAAEAHPLDPALAKARDGLKTSQESIDDYTCVLVKRERINGTLNPHEFMVAKIRNRKVADGQVVVPFSVYLQFVKPAEVKGREVLYIEGQNNGKMYAHDTGLKGILSVWIRPDGPIAMNNNRYPLTEIGIENLIVRLIEKGERDRRNAEPCEVTFRENATINGRKCTLLQVTHPQRKPHLDFCTAQVFIDDELGIPIRYAAYDFPARTGDPPMLIEEYTYLNLKVNVGLTNFDFDAKNPNYKF